MIHLGVVRVCGVEIPVRLGDEGDNANLAGAYGCYDLDEGVIWISVTCPAHEMNFWIAHETMHALMQKSGALRVTAMAFGLDVENRKKDAKIAARWEETIIRVLTPHLLETFGPVRGTP